MKKTTKSPPDAVAFGQGIADGLSINLLVKDVQVATAFATEVLSAVITYEDEDFAIVTAQGTQWMLHADHTYLDNAMMSVMQGIEVRGAGCEIRLHGRDPDEAEAAARARDDIVLAGAMDKPHGRREAIIVDPDGYTWVPDTAI